MLLQSQRVKPSNVLIFGWFVLGVFGFSFVLDISDVAGIIVDFVGDGLDAAIGQKNAVRAGHYFAIAALLVAEVEVSRVVFDGVVEAIRVGWLKNTKNKRID